MPAAIRSSAPVSPFRYLSHATAVAMVFKLILAAARRWRTLKGSNQLLKLIQGVKSPDGIEVTETNQNAAA
jgi:hypothetical protein